MRVLHSTLAVLFSGFFMACSSSVAPEIIKEQVAQAEASFNQMAAEEGVAEAFLFFAAEDAVLNRNGSLIRGKEEIASYFDLQPYRDVQLTWHPDFIDIAQSGDLAYTYGNYSFSATDSSGQIITTTGIFHTVWKRQEDGSWKYVYD